MPEHESDHGGRRARIAFWVLAALAVLALAARAAARAFTYDAYEIELSPFDGGWMLQAPFRAGLGEWSGRDYVVPRGPLWQALSFVGTAFGALPWRWTAAGNELVFGLPSIAIAAVCVRRSVRRPIGRALAFALLAVLILWEPADSLRWVATLAVAIVYALPTKEDEHPDLRAGVASAAITALLVVFAFERAVMAGVSLALMTAFALALGRRDFPLRAQLRRAAGLALGLAACVAVLAALFAAASASLAGYVEGILVLSRAYAITMHSGAGAWHAPLIALGLCMGVGAVILAWRRQGDLADATLLFGVPPTLVAGLVRNDSPHIFMGACVALGALAIVGLRQLEAGRAPVAGIAGVLTAVSLLALVPTHGAPLNEWLRIGAPLDAEERARLRTRDASYESDVTLTADFLRARHRAGPLACVALDESLGAAHVLAGIGGPVGLRWNQQLQSERADAIRAAACPLYVHRHLSLDSELRWAGWVFGEDFLEVARSYRPIRELGPAVVVLERRARRAELVRRRIGSARLGEWHELALDGELELVFDRPLRETSLVRIEYELELSPLSRALEEVPLPEVAFANANGEEAVPQSITFMQFVGRNARLVAPDPWAAERRWLEGVEPDDEASVDRMRIRLRDPSGNAADRVRIRIRALTELEPPAIDPIPPPPLPRDDGGARDLLAARGLVARFSTPRDDRGRLLLEPHPEERLTAAAYVRITPELGDRLSGEVSLGSDRSDGATLRIALVDPAGDRRSRRVVLRELALEPGASMPFELPIDPWVGRSVWLELASLARGGSDYDWLWLTELRVVPSSAPETVAGALRAGIARASASAGVDGYGDVRLHAAAPGAPASALEVPLAPGSARCLTLGLRHRGTEGDGAWVEAIADDRGERTTLFREHLRPGDERELPPIDLGSATALTVRTEPGASSAHDWVELVLPRVTACPLSGDEISELAVAFANGRARARHVEPSLDEGAIFLHPNAPSRPPAEVGFPLGTTAQRCLELGIELRSERGDGAIVEGEVRSRESAVTLFSVRVSPGAPRAVGPLPLPASGGELVFRSLPNADATYDWVYLVDPRIVPCAR